MSHKASVNRKGGHPPGYAESVGRLPPPYQDAPAASHPPSFLFCALPASAISRALAIIFIHSSVKTFENLIKTWPQLSDFVLIVSDSRDEPHTLLQVPTIPSIPLLDACSKPWLVQESTRFIILSYSLIEELSTAFMLSDAPMCPYARFITTSTPVLIRTYSTTNLTYQHISSIAWERNCPGLYRYHYSNSQFGELVGALDDLGVSSGKKRPYVKSTPLLLYEKGKYGFPGRWSYGMNQCVTTMDIQGISRFGEYVDINQVQKLKVQFSKRCLGGSYPCRRNSLILNAGVLVDLYVKFNNSQCPSLSRNSMYPSVIEAREKNSNSDPIRFTLINTNWTMANPFGVVCQHHQKLSKDQATCCWSNKIDYNLSYHDIVTLVGLPDTLLLSLCLYEVRELTWKRLAPKPKSSMISQDLSSRFIEGKELYYLQVQNLIHNYETSQNPMARFEVQKLKRLDLFALEGSEEAWDLRRVVCFPSSSVFQPSLSVVNMSTYALSSKSVPLSVSTEQLSPVLDCVEELNVMGYNPKFSCQSSGYMFSRLASLRIDMSSTHRRKDGSTVLDFPDKHFPALKELKLDYQDKLVLPPFSIELVSIPLSIDRLLLNSLMGSICVKIGGHQLEENTSSVKLLDTFVCWQIVEKQWKLSTPVRELPYYDWMCSL